MTLHTTTTYHATFLPASVADPNNVAATWHYDSYGRPDWSTSYLGATTTYAYDYSQHFSFCQ
jgi:hypothetical protein